jgi:hypothetical protein
MNTTTAVQKLRRILQNQNINFDSESDVLIDSIGEAVEKYNDDYPVDIIVTLNGNGTGVIDFPVTFTSDFSIIKSVEYPVSDITAEKTYIDESERGLYEKPSGTLQLLLYETAPASGDEVRVSFTKHIELVSEVRTFDQTSVLKLAAYFACVKEASKEFNTTSNGQALDFVDFTTSANGRFAVAEKFLQDYLNHIFGDPKKFDNLEKTVAAYSAKQWKTNTTWNTSRIFHKDDI